jgi:hypothetical protein
MSLTPYRRRILLVGVLSIMAVAAGCAKPSVQSVEQPKQMANQIEESVEQDLPFALPGRYVKSSEIRNLFSGKTFYGTYFHRAHSVEYYAPDGTALYRWDETLTCRGQWYVVRDYACFHYPSLHAGGDSCYQVSKAPSANRLTMIPSGRYQEDTFVVRKIEPGDAEGLTQTSPSTCE